VGPFADLYANLALGKLAALEGRAPSPEQETDILASCEVLNAKLSLSFGSTLLFNSRVLASLASRGDEARDIARTITKADAGIWGVGVSKGDVHSMCRNSLSLPASVPDADALAQFREWCGRERGSQERAAVRGGLANSSFCRCAGTTT
jgi:hypothetical protein